MDNRVIAEKYEILDTLFSNELQSVYSAKESGADNSQQFIINEYKDTDIIYNMKDNFSKEKCQNIRNIVETIYENFCFYVVCNICPGPTLEDFLSDNNLRLTEKMYLTDSFLSQIVEIEKLSPFIVYPLCNNDNLYVTSKRSICFNCNLMLTEDVMAASRNDVSRRVGEIINAIFSNTVATDSNSAKNNLPPALFPIVQSCLEGKCESMSKVYNEFKTLLLYSVFMDGKSIDSQIRANYQRAKTKRKLTPVRRLAALVLIFLLAGGAWIIIKDWDLLTFNKTAIVNTKPVAEFTADKKQIYEGETITFTSNSSDPDVDDGIKSYLWVISKAEKPVFDSTNQDLSYTFSEAGKYGVHLVVTDTHEESSEPFRIFIDVLPKLILPSIDPDSEEENTK